MKNSIFVLTAFLILIVSCQEKTIRQVYQPNAEQGKDAVISEAYGKNNFSKIDRLHLLSLTVKDTIDNDSRFLLRIGFSNIPQDAKIDSAFVHLTAIEPGHFGDNNAFRVEMIKEVWINDDVNWDNQPRSFTENAIKVAKTDDKFENQKINITPFIKDIVSNKAQNFGFLFRLESEEKPYKGVRFYSSDTSDSDKRPKLEVYYRL
jgi:hypothetical protein